MSTIISCFAASVRSSLKSSDARSLTKSTTSEMTMTVWRFLSRAAMNRSGTVKSAARFAATSRWSRSFSKIWCAM